MVTYFALLLLVALERVAELAVSSHNARRAREQGGVETGTALFGPMALMHAAFLACCALEVALLRRPFPGAAGFLALGLVGAAQGLRWWAISSLASAWNVRVIVVPGQSPVRRGPYRLMRHPNYLAVAVEIAALPLVHGAWLTAVVFSALNAAVLRARIRAEELALGPRWEATFAGVPRFWPSWRRGG